jgi:hypothetical protein
VADAPSRTPGSLDVKAPGRLTLAVISPDFTGGLAVFLLLWIAAVRADRRRERGAAQLPEPTPGSRPCA